MLFAWKCMCMCICAPNINISNSHWFALISHISVNDFIYRYIFTIYMLRFTKKAEHFQFDHTSFGNFNQLLYLKFWMVSSEGKYLVTVAITIIATKFKWMITTRTTYALYWNPHSEFLMQVSFNFANLNHAISKQEKLNEYKYICVCVFNTVLK